MTEVEQQSPPQNGIDLSATEDEESSKARPADIEQDMREMERRKRVEAIMGSKLFREELERIVDCARDSGNAAGILQQLSDIVGVPSSRVGSVFKTTSCMLPINDIRGVESMGYAKGEKILRCKLAATFRLLDLYGWTQGLGAQITARLKVDQEYFLVNPYGLLYHEITASSLNKVDMQGNIVEQGTTNFGVNKSHFVLHSVVHAARPDIRCAIYIGCSPVVAISSLKTGLLPLTKDACVLGELTSYSYIGYLHDEEERNKLVRNLGPNSKVMLLSNHGALCCGETIEEAFFAACHIVQACETQLKLLPVGLDNLVLIPEESRKVIYDQSRRPPEDLEKKFAAATISDSNKGEEEKKEGAENTTKVIGQAPKWRVGGAEFEALMRMLDNAGYRTGYIYRHPLIKSEPPKPKNDVELPPAVSSLGYLLEEEELFRQGIWKKGDLRKGGDRSRWLNSPNVYQKVEVLETGTPDPKKITKWVAEGSPTHSTPVRIDDPLQFVPVNTNPKEFKRVQQQIKDNRRADKISAGPQSHILEGVTWDEANRIKDATVSSAGDHVVLMGAASKGIIQRGFQHNAAVYKAPYAKNPFDNVTDDELNEYKRTVERKKKSIHGEYTDTDFSESEALSSLQTSGAQQQTKQTTTTTTTTTAAVSQSEPEDISEHQVMRIQTEQAPVPSQPEVVLSDDDQFLMKSYKTSQGLEIQSSIDSPRHHLSSINRCESAIQDVGGGIEEEENSFFSETQENKLKFYNLKYVNNFKNNFYFEKLIKFTPTFSNYTYTPNKPFNENQGNGNLIFSSIYTTPYQYFSKNTENIDNTHYSPCTDDNISIVRENYSNTDTNFRSNDIKEDHKHCHNPQLCSQIFETLLHSKSLRNQEFLKRSHFENNSNITICKDNYDDGNSAKYPYRTVSHFGFNTPIRYPQPHHKHLAVNLKKCQKYVPLGRSISYEEIFSSPRYLDLCEFCFELIVHLKPELTKCDTKLNNLTEYSDVCFKLVSNDNKNQSETHNYITNLKKHHSEFCHPLHSVEEMKETATDTCYKEDSYDISSSTFHDKIPCKNYSEVYSNTDYMQSRYLLSTPISFPELVYNSENRTQYGSNNNISDQMTELCDDFNNFDVLKNNNNEFFENTVKIKEFESISNMFMNRDELKCRKFMKENISSNENINNSQYAKKYSNVKTNVSNISCALKDVNSEKDSTFTNKSNVHQLTVEEFNRTLSRITISSTQRNSLADVHDNPSRFPIVNIENDENKNSSYKNSSFDGIQELPAQNRKINAVNFNKNVEDENIDKYSPLERTILRKIRTNKLSKRDDIFGKIENTIRNKRTPSKLELIIKEQLLVLPDKDMNKQIKNPKFKSIRKSYSASPPKNYFSTPKSKLNKVSSISSDSIRNIASVSKIKSNSNIIRSCPQKTINKASKSRNFILENIRNVSNIRHFPQIKHFPSNIDNKSGKCCSRLLSFEDSVCTNKQLKSMSPRNTASSEIYPFQSKLVKGSARFWVSMSEKGLAEKSKTFLAKKRKLLTTSLNTTPINTNVSTVDNEINALGAEIQQIHPRLENYKRKLDEFGNRVADCVNNINECVATQENIIDLQKKLRNSIQSHQYSEKIMCRVQTFSLSETED